MTVSSAYAIEHWSRIVPDQPAIDFEDDVVTYRDLNNWVDRTAHLLSERGVARGDRLAIAGGSCLEWAVLNLAIHRVGAIVVPFNIRLTPSELGVLVEECTPAFVACDDELRPRLEQVHASNPTFELIDFADITGLRSGTCTAFPQVEVEWDDPVTLVFTSGTTGRPKAVIYTYTSLAASMYEVSLLHDVRKNDHRPWLALPLYTAIGVIYSLERTMLHGGTLILDRSFHPEKALRRIQDARVTFIGAPAIVYDQIADAPDFADADLSSLRNTDVGGSRVEGDTIQKWMRHGVVIRQMYGQTEIGGYGTVNSDSLAVSHPEYCGAGGVFTRIRVVDPEGKDCAPGEIGQILLRGPGMTPGYWGRPEATARTIIDGWIHTGDLGRLDQQGNLTFIDRMKDMIITGGFNVAPVEIETVIEQIPGVQEVAVVAVPDPKFQETPAALVRADRELSPDEVVAHCSEHLADYKIPRYVVMVDSPLPRTATGKLEKSVLRAEAYSVPELHPKLR
ncbi:long-chain fatty acid--CoA ligase [Brevibacterium daeguense]|uniref:Long-chain fatty acid--CoA ligase n=1 Tax=Brevibacterium daeguense TaxID=909936 RepID=A0ABP8EF90_9MICO|nr:class I adenylate-forming enzyme family protein [Brevibacterium daeguense]